MTRPADFTSDVDFSKLSQDRIKGVVPKTRDGTGHARDVPPGQEQDHPIPSQAEIRKLLQAAQCLRQHSSSFG